MEDRDQEDKILKLPCQRSQKVSTVERLRGCDEFREGDSSTESKEETPRLLQLKKSIVFNLPRNLNFRFLPNLGGGYTSEGTIVHEMDGDGS